MIHEITTINQLKNTISQIFPSLTKGVIYLHGDLGSGKTTFVSLFLKQFGLQEQVSSPSYTLINEYTIDNIHILHADLYRLSSPDELIYLDVDEWEQRADTIFIEWPEKGLGYIPQPKFSITLTFNGKQRLLEWTNNVRL
ncbi:tRNA (adenosine(37)-N6)-threonylcarbamoyltransferase complex ATPase subunit type 1 TsaE [Suttonella ornithocola]|uniref:tRNA threonylcarbamoyladenosine biosynthesis protein TsaE n=1 Tax=Suttonella ornithocola TaxID=279832 RepID=A0A380MUF0_9GAMM|nr:tRNA (adenosine(37)-N6)-threonylcarbamoyltransferase complex ATPase subunit type 1 TsaE [Suttonella ornithocola]SUO95543.1 ADP-binding protein [Suttonella ornithocola]